MNPKYNLIVVLGPTASGKTDFAAHLASICNAEIISADSRQIYRGMTIGTGKDLADYCVDEKNIPYHIIDIAEAGEKYNVYRYQNDFFEAFEKINANGHLPIMCGGTGLYIEAVLKGYRLINVPPNYELRSKLENKTLEELTQILSKYRKLHNTSDTDTVKRAIRNIEIEEYYAENPEIDTQLPKLSPLIIGLDVDRETRRGKITKRLHDRLNEGMVDEIRGLIDKGVSPEDLIYYGLEYKFVTQYIIGQLTYQDMVEQLNIAIHQFAKRQMTWFRGMETRGIHVNWIDATLPMEERLQKAIELMK